MAKKNRPKDNRSKKSRGSSQRSRSSDAANRSYRLAESTPPRSSGDLATDQTSSDQPSLGEHPIGRPWLRRIVTLVILIHLGGVFFPPLHFQTDDLTNAPLGNQSMVATLQRPVEAYSQFLFLNRGYAFFAPDPGPSHLFQAAIEEPTGERTETLYPDRVKQWPRLNYHRHFMLAEYLTSVHVAKPTADELSQLDERTGNHLKRLRRRYEFVRKSMIDHLSHANEGKTAKLLRLEHLIPSHEEFINLSVHLKDRANYIPLVDPPAIVVQPSGENTEAQTEELAIPAGTPEKANAENASVPVAPKPEIGPALEPSQPDQPETDPSDSDEGTES